MKKKLRAYYCANYANHANWLANHRRDLHGQDIDHHDLQRQDAGLGLETDDNTFDDATIELQDVSHFMSGGG